MSDQNPIDSISFQELCDRFEKVEMRMKKAKKQVGHKRNMTKKYSDDIMGDALKLCDGHSPFPLVRLIMSKEERLRHYNIKVIKLADIYVEVALGAQNHSEEAQALLQVGKHSFDPGEAIYNVTLKRKGKNFVSNKTVGMVNQLLDDLAGKGEEERSGSSVDRNGGKSKKKWMEIYQHIYQEYSPLEQKWLARIVLKDMKLGASCSAQHILGKSGFEAFKTNDDLEKVCKSIANEAEIELKGLTPLVFFKPMLAQLLPVKLNVSTAVLESMDGCPFYMDLKIDGFRIVLHKKGDQIKLWTRNNHDYTDMYSVFAQECPGLLLPEECIIDGEMTAWDDESKRVVDISMNNKYANEEKKYEEDKNKLAPGVRASPKMRWIQFTAFDMVYIGGKTGEMIIDRTLSGGQGDFRPGDMTSWPLHYRRAVLQQSLKITAHRMELVEHRLVNSPDLERRIANVYEYFDDVMQRGHEGLIFKKFDGPYVATSDSRNSKNWFKLKPDSIDGMIDDMDFAVLGAYDGKKGHKRGISSFVIGVRDDRPDSNGVVPPLNEQKFIPISSVGSGYNNDELQNIRDYVLGMQLPCTVSNSAEITRREESCWREFGPINHKRYFVPPWIAAPWVPKRDLIPTCWFSPHAEQSFCFQVKTYEITYLDPTLYEGTHSWAEYGLRFPRVQFTRKDKSARDCMSFTELVTKQKQPRTTLAEAEVARSSVSKKKKNPDRKRGHEVTTVASQFSIQAKDYELVEYLDQTLVAVFAHTSFFISPGCDYTGVPGIQVMRDRPSKAQRGSSSFSSTSSSKNSETKMLKGKDALIKWIDAAGGTILPCLEGAQAGDGRTLIVVGNGGTASKEFDYTTNNSYRTNTQFDTVHMDWVFDSLQEKRKLDVTPKYLATSRTKGRLLGCSERTKDKWGTSIGALGDSYLELLQPHELSRRITLALGAGAIKSLQLSTKALPWELVKHWPQEDAMKLALPAGDDVTGECVSGGDFMWDPCKQLFFAMPLEAVPTESSPMVEGDAALRVHARHILESMEMVAAIHGAWVAPCLLDSTTHIVMHTSQAIREDVLQDLRRMERSARPRLVGTDWVAACVDAGCFVDESNFLIAVSL